MFFALLLAGCASLGSAPRCDCERNEDAAAGVRDTLNDGYSLFYSNATGLAKLDWLTTLKFESDAFQRVIDDIAQTNDEIHARMDTLAEDFPALDLKRKPLPAIQQAVRKRERQKKIDELMPVVGKSGRAYERNLLLSMRSVLGHQAILADEIATREPDGALREIMGSFATRYRQLHDRVIALLEERHFR